MKKKIVLTLFILGLLTCVSVNGTNVLRSEKLSLFKRMPLYGYLVNDDEVVHFEPEDYLREEDSNNEKLMKLRHEYY